MQCQVWIKSITIYLTCVTKKAHLLLTEEPTKQIGGTSHLGQHYCELKYITLARITQYIVARLVTIQILHFTEDKVKTPAVILFVSPCLYI